MLSGLQFLLQSPVHVDVVRTIHSDICRIRKLCCAVNDFDYDQSDGPELKIVVSGGEDEDDDDDDEEEHARRDSRRSKRKVGERKLRLNSNKSLASQLAGLSVLERQALLAEYERQHAPAVTVKSDDKQAIKQLTEQMAQLMKVVRQVSEYKEHVSSASRAAESPKAVSVAALTQDRLEVILLPTQDTSWSAFTKLSPCSVGLQQSTCLHMCLPD